MSSVNVGLLSLLISHLKRVLVCWLTEKGLNFQFGSFRWDSVVELSLLDLFIRGARLIWLCLSYLSSTGP